MSVSLHDLGLFTHFPVFVSISIFVALSTVLHSINSPDNCLFSDSVLPVLSLPFIDPFFYFISL